VIITEPGIYDIPETEYHADCVPAEAGGSLSVSGTKLLLPPVPPAKYAYAREHGHLPTKAQKLGTLAHAMTFRQPTGHYAALDYDAWNAAGCKAAKAEALDAGRTPVLRKEWDEAVAISGAIRSHPTAGPLLAEGEAEQSMFWRDPEFGIWLRMRADFTTWFHMPTIVDLKTTKDASKDGFAKSVHDYGYHRQDPWYRQGWAAQLGCDWRDIDFIFAVVETEPPYLVATYRISDGTDGPDDVGLGLEQCRIAREIYRDCTASGSWPGYSEEIETLELPRYRRLDTERQVNEWHS